MHCHHPHHHAPCHCEGCNICNHHTECMKHNTCQCHKQGHHHADCPYHGCEACQRHSDCEEQEVCQHLEDQVCPFHTHADADAHAHPTT